MFLDIFMSMSSYKNQLSLFFVNFVFILNFHEMNQDTD